MRFFRGWLCRSLLDRYSSKDGTYSQDTVDQMYEVTKEDARKMSMRSRGIPLVNSHRGHLVVGKVTKSEVSNKDGEDRDWSVEVEIDDSTSSGKLVCGLLDKGMFNHFSLTHDPSTMEPIHVALCWRGAREGTTVTPVSASAASKAILYKPQKGMKLVHASYSELQEIKMAATAAAATIPGLDNLSDAALQELQNHLMQTQQNRKQQQQQGSGGGNEATPTDAATTNATTTESSSSSDDAPASTDPLQTVKSGYNKLLAPNALLNKNERRAIIEDKQDDVQTIAELQRKVAELEKNQESLQKQNADHSENYGAILMEFLKDHGVNIASDTDRKEILSSMSAVKPALMNAIVAASFNMKRERQQLLASSSSSSPQAPLTDPNNQAREFVNQLFSSSQYQSYANYTPPPLHQPVMVPVEASYNSRVQSMNHNLKQLASTTAGWNNHLPTATKRILDLAPDSKIRSYVDPSRIPKTGDNGKRMKLSSGSSSSSSSTSPDDPLNFHSLPVFE